MTQGSADPRLWGIDPTYEGLDGEPVAVPADSLALFIDRMRGAGGSAVPSPTTADEEGEAQPVCHLPPWLGRRRSWGVSVQLYELRSARNWGIGDFLDLERLALSAARTGADFIGLNPLHALFLADPARCSPFSPSNRRFLNPLYIAVDQVEGYDATLAPSAELEALRAGDLVDYPGVAALKLRALRAMFDCRSPSDASALQGFRNAGGEALELHARFEALSLHLGASGFGSGWHEWPAPFRSANSAAVLGFARSHDDEIAFQVWLQWIARGQLDRAAARAREAGMTIGLYLDFAVGEAPDGSATWSDPSLSVSGVTIGAPPDLFSKDGQNWGLAPLSPARISEAGYRPYRAIMEAAIKGAGALRLDHVMSLRHLFWIPEGRHPDQGGFVRYPTRGLLRVLADLSRANGTIVIGEDLGHVPDGFRDEMAAAGILSYRILYFEQDQDGFVSPESWPELSLACLSTHDLPTLRGWWAGHDTRLRLAYGLIDADAAQQQEAERKRHRVSLLASMARAGIPVTAAAGSDPRRDDPRDDERFLKDLAVAMHRYVARTRSAMAVMRLADAVAEDQPTNLPGIADAYPNWRRKLNVMLEDLPDHPIFRSITGAFAEERPR